MMRFCLSCVLIKDLDECLIKDSIPQNIVAKNKDRIRSTRKNEEDPRSLSAITNMLLRAGLVDLVWDHTIFHQRL